MITRYRVSVDGVQLDSLDSSIYILDIKESAPKLDVKAVEKSGADGFHVTAIRRASVQVEITFAIRHRNPAQRQSVMDKVIQWTNGSHLTTSPRSDKRLYCVCVGLPVITSALDWTEDLKMTFAAYEKPYWESASEHMYRADLMTEYSRTIAISGTAPTVLEMRIVNASSSTINSITIMAGSSMMVLSGLGLSAGETLRITHDDRGYVKILIDSSNGTRSKYSALQPQSTDDLIVQPGANAVMINASSVVNIAILYKPRWK